MGTKSHILKALPGSIMTKGICVIVLSIGCIQDWDTCLTFLGVSLVCFYLLSIMWMSGELECHECEMDSGVFYFIPFHLTLFYSIWNPCTGNLVKKNAWSRHSHALFYPDYSLSCLSLWSLLYRDKNPQSLPYHLLYTAFSLYLKGVAGKKNYTLNSPLDLVIVAVFSLKIHLTALWENRSVKTCPGFGTLTWVNQWLHSIRLRISPVTSLRMFCSDHLL